MIKIYGHPRTSAGRCYLMLEEVGQPYEAVPIDMFKAREHKAPAYLKLNPNGKVPSLVDGDVVLWESIAINHYLAERYKPELLGTSPAERALIAQWNLWAMLELQPPLIDVLIETFMKTPEQRDQAIIDRGLEAIPPLLLILDGALADRPYLLGDKVSLADLNVLTVYSITTTIKLPTTRFTNCERWFKSLLERPAVKRWQELRGAR